MMKAVVMGAVLVMSVGSAVAQTQSPAVPVADQRFVMNTNWAGIGEVELGKLASEKAVSPDVKSFGQRMATDHGKAGDELKTLAQSKGITLPTDMDAKHKSVRDRLMKLSGEAFDHAYIAEMVNGHRQAVAAFRTEAKTGKDPDIKAFAEKTLPTVQDHLKVAQSLSKAVGTSGKK
jgi:putative membrane protein